MPQCIAVHVGFLIVDIRLCSQFAYAFSAAETTIPAVKVSANEAKYSRGDGLLFMVISSLVGGGSGAFRPCPGIS